MNPTTLFKESLEWLKKNYHRYEFFMERDIVWTVQQHLREEVKKKNLPYRIVNDWPVMTAKRRSLCADLAIIQDVNDRPTVVFFAEFKYEPDHTRTGDFSQNKLKQSVVFWSGAQSVEKDIQRVRGFSKALKCEGVSIFIDEGSRFFGKPRWKTFEHSDWEKWNKEIAVLVSWSGSL